jgi:hypothetical protein
MSGRLPRGRLYVVDVGDGVLLDGLTELADPAIHANRPITLMESADGAGMPCDARCVNC